MRTRVAAGGHNIPDATIEPRYFVGIRNFLHLYQSSVDEWLLADNSGAVPMMIARRTADGLEIHTPEVWQRFNQIRS